MHFGPRAIQRSGGGARLSRPREGGFSLIELLVVAALIVILFTVLYSDKSQSYQSSQLSKCENNLQNVYVALQTYSIANTDSFPALAEAKTAEEPLSELVPKYTTGGAYFTCPGCNDPQLPEAKPFARRKISYAYYMGRKTVDGPDQPLMSDRQVNTNSKQIGQLVFSPDGKKPGSNHNKYGGNILFCDGSIKFSPARSAFVLTDRPGVILLNPRP